MDSPTSLIAELCSMLLDSADNPSQSREPTDTSPCVQQGRFQTICFCWDIVRWSVSVSFDKWNIISSIEAKQVLPRTTNPPNPIHPFHNPSNTPPSFQRGYLLQAGLVKIQLLESPIAPPPSIAIALCECLSQFWLRLIKADVDHYNFI